ncbi:MAG: FHA domain-containing protein [Elusimicrobia bacterium]|nr:FHA domain-containing protein [Elusimicrobiota bacterium]
MPKLLLKFESSVIKEINLDKPLFSIGRKPDNDIVLEHTTVSGYHCKIYDAGGSFFVEDLGSTNGTFLNGKKILKSGLHQNDAVGIVKYTLIFVEDGKKAEEISGISPGIKFISPKIQKRVKAFLEVLEGIVDKQEYEIIATSTYIGKSGQANIPIKGSGIFGSAPDMAAVIAMRPDGFFLMPIKEGFAKHNGSPLKTKITLKDDDTIEAGGTKFRFFIKSE